MKHARVPKFPAGSEIASDTLPNAVGPSLDRAPPPCIYDQRVARSRKTTRLMQIRQTTLPDNKHKLPAAICHQRYTPRNVPLIRHLEMATVTIAKLDRNPTHHQTSRNLPECQDIHPMTNISTTAQVPRLHKRMKDTSTNPPNIVRLSYLNPGNPTFPGVT